MSIHRQQLCIYHRRINRWMYHHILLFLSRIFFVVRYYERINLKLKKWVSQIYRWLRRDSFLPRIPLSGFLSHFMEVWKKVSLGRGICSGMRKRDVSPKVLRVYIFIYENYWSWRKIAYLATCFLNWNRVK